MENPDVVSLAAGLVDPQSLPVKETREITQRLLADDQYARQILQYGTTQGAEPLRQQLLEHLAKLENQSTSSLGIDLNQIILTTGSQQLLSIIGEVLFDPGDICLVAAPTYFVFLGLLKGIGARAIPVQTDENGMCMEALEATLQQLEQSGELERVKLIYLVSYYENPSGISLSEERRRNVVEIVQNWSRSHRLLILEDAAYRELRYDGPELPSVWHFDSTRQHVILTQTFSKTYSPGIRVGFGVVPSDLVQPICDRKGNEDFGSANFNQHLIAQVLEQKLYDQHVEQVRSSYRKKRDVMLTAADKYFSELPGVNWVHPHGGLYVWMTLPDHIDTGFESPLFRQATHIEKMMYVPGEICHAGPEGSRPKNQMRLSFGVQDPQGIDLGMKRLANAVQAIMNDG
ncbi:MAG: PLP-dependent aminotransferase family protein [Planctomycetaceae bacterium]